MAESMLALKPRDAVLARACRRFGPLGLEAMDAWRELEAEAGIELIELYGIVELVADRSITSAAGLEACGVEYSWLDAVATRELGALLPDGWSALFQPEAGIVRSDL